jgi:hypothetical protein
MLSQALKDKATIECRLPDYVEDAETLWSQG